MQSKSLRALRILNGLIATFFLASAPAGAQTPEHAAAQLKSLLVRPADGSVRVIFSLTRPVRYKATRTADPSRIVIDLPQTGISPVFTKREILSAHPALTRVLVSRSGGATRIVLDLGSAGAHTVYSIAGELAVEIKTKAATVEARTAPAPLVGSTLPAAGVIVPDVAPQRPDFDVAASKASVTIPWVPLGPTIDDFISRNSAPTAAHVANFRQREPSDGSPVSEDTTAYLSYDNEYLYAVFVCRDGSGDVRRHLASRDTIAGDDQVALYLDTFHDGRHAYVFASNPFGVQQDGVISDGDDPSYTADMLWQSRGRLTPDGFIVLMAIPFKTLRFSPDSVQDWRFAVARTIARRGETAYWPHISRRVNGFVRQMASLDGIELISPGRNVQLTPYAALTRTRSFDEGTLANTRADSRYAGVDAKIVIKNAVTIDAAVNPEFSEVESDDPLIIVNQRFEPFRPEKRPFFMESAAVFDTPINVLFSRRILDPSGGVRLTSRSTGWAVGGLVANDRAVAPDAPGGAFGLGAAIGAARVQRLFGERSSIGVLTTERDDGRARNRVVSADGRLQMTAAWTLSGQAVKSDDENGVSRESGTAYAAALSRTGPHFSYVGGYRDIGRDLRVPLGFVPRQDIRVTEQYAGYVWRAGESGSWSLGPAATAVVDWNHAGQLQDRWTSVDFGVSGAGQLDAHMSRAESYELYSTTPFRTSATSVSVSSGALQWLSLWGSYSRGAAINYTPAAGVAPFLGSKQDAYASVTIRPSARVAVQALALHEAFQTIPDVDSSRSQRVFTTNLLRAKLKLQVTRSLSLRGIVDYDALDSDPSLFSDSRYSRLMGDVLVTFLLHPGTALYAGFNNRYENLILEPGANAAIEHTGLPRFPVGQQLFLKMSYLFRF